MTKLIYPLFVTEDLVAKTESSMNNVFYHTLNSVISEIEECLSLDITDFLLIGIPVEKDISQAANPNNIACRACALIKKHFQDQITLYGDVCLSPYQISGHSMILDGETVLKDKSLEIVSRLALNLAKAGVDFVAPVISVIQSTQKIRRLLNENGCQKVKIMPYSAKFASSFYAPYRQTIGSPLTFGGKENYQINPLDTQSALDILLDDEADADILMIKPGLPYLDVLYQAKQLTQKPIAVYQVSGEYQMLESAAKQNFIDWDLGLLEVFHCFQRAGADYLISYATKDMAKILKI